MPDKWWYDVIKKALGDLEEGVGFNETMTNYAELMRVQLMQAIVESQPYGHEELDDSGYAIYARPPKYTVSNRIGHTPIEDGWRPEVEDIPDRVGLSLKLNNVSEHIKWVLGGAPRHDILPRKHPYLFFWWGDPQRWPAPEVSYTGKEMGPGYYRMYRVDHPGQKPNPFVDKSRDATRSGMTELDKAGVSKYLTKLMTDAGLRAI